MRTAEVQSQSFLTDRECETFSEVICWLLNKREYKNHAEFWLVFGLILFYFSQVYVQPHFDYNPANDNLIPCREAGLAFKRGDILQIVNREDPNWWQVWLLWFDLFWLICIGRLLYFTDSIVLTDRHAMWWKEVLGWFPVSFWKKRGKHLFLKTLMEQVIHLNTLLLPKHSTKWQKYSETSDTVWKTCHINVLVFGSINKYLGEN